MHRFFLVISRAVVGYDGREGTALDPLTGSAGALPKRCRLGHAVRNHAMLPGPAAIRVSGWVCFPAAVVAVEDVGAWPHSVGLFVKWAAFLGTLHWLASLADLGVGRGSNVELLLLFELWVGERLVLEKAVPGYRRLGRPVSAVPFVQALIFGDRAGLLGSYQVIVCSACGIGRFVPCLIGANHCRLLHIRWEKKLSRRPFLMCF